MNAAPLIRRPHPRAAPRWWQRLLLHVQLFRLGSRQATVAHDVAFLQRELALIRNLLDQTKVEAAYIDEEIAWARSNLARLQ